MADKNELTIRTVKVTDIDNLKNFFVKAYGPMTIFQNELFLLHYFDSRMNSNAPMSKCLIGISPEGEIVSHYGGLYYNLKIQQEIHPIIWGVSAYTLPEWRGMGLNSKIVDFIIKNNEINGVIGFTRETASFYQNLGYNIFDFDRLTRYILILDYKKTLEVVHYIKQNTNRFNELTQTHKEENLIPDVDQVIKLTKENIRNFKLNMDEELTGITTTQRTVDFLIWRFFGNPYIKYSIYGFIKDKTVLTYIALREEKLEPLNHKINRIIDLYGKKEGINPLLNISLKESISKNHIYLDFSMFGTIYNKELLAFDFIKLENDDCCILPQVTSPIENRSNGEFLGIQSNPFRKVVENLTKNTVYFTRMDSDRDRLAKISQIEQIENNLT